MKKFINKTTEITAKGEDGQVISLTFADLAIKTLNVMPRGGMVPSEMRIRFKLEDKLVDQEVGVTIELDDSDVEKLKTLSDIPWIFKHRDVLAYQEHLEELLK